MLLQTNSYIVPKDRRAEHARLLRRFRQTLARLGCDHFEVYEQVGQNWTSEQTSGRFVQIMHFRDRRHQLAVQAAERSDPTAQRLIAEFCEIINFPYQQQHGLFAVGFYTGALPAAPARPAEREAEQGAGEEQVAAASPAAAVADAAEAPTPDQQTYVAPATVDQSSSTEAPPAPAVEGPTVSALQPVDLPQEPEAEAARDQVAEATAAVDSDVHRGALDELAAAPDEAEPVHDAHEAGTNGDFAALPADDEFGDQPSSGHLAREPDGDLDGMLEEHFSPPADVPAAHDNGDQFAAPDNGQGNSLAGGSGISQVLDRASLDIDDLDVPLPAELIDDDELEPNAPASHGDYGGHLQDESHLHG